MKWIDHYIFNRSNINIKIKTEDIDNLSDKKVFLKNMKQGTLLLKIL